ncbi:MAG: hypothetical protein ACUVTD_05395 [Nitrososphaerales archaeon]
MPIFLPAIRDPEFEFIHWLHTVKENIRCRLVVDTFKNVPEIVEICRESPSSQECYCIKEALKSKTQQNNPLYF